MATSHKTRDRTFTTHIDIPAEKRAALIETLNQQLANTLDLYTQVKQAHWNVKGKDFYQLHLLFDEIAEELEPFIDSLAERVTLLGGYANGTARMAAEHSVLPEFPTNITEGREYIEALVERFGLYVGPTREGSKDADEIGDPATADLYNDISRVGRQAALVPRSPPPGPDGRISRFAGNSGFKTPRRSPDRRGVVRCHLSETPRKLVAISQQPRSAAMVKPTIPSGIGPVAPARMISDDPTIRPAITTPAARVWLARVSWRTSRSKCCKSNLTVSSPRLIDSSDVPRTSGRRVAIRWKSSAVRAVCVRSRRGP